MLRKDNLKCDSGEGRWKISTGVQEMSNEHVLIGALDTYSMKE